jgi:hypothetical protein
MRSIACATGLALLAVACTAVEKKEDPAATDSAAAAAAAVTAAPLMPGVSGRTESPKATAKPSPKKSASKNSTGDSMRDSATEPTFEVGADGKVQRIKK